MQCEASILPVANPFTALQRDFERRISQNHRGSFGSLRVSESDSEVLIELDVPGAAEENLELTIHDGRLLLSGRRNQSTPGGATELYSDRGPAQFQRVLQLHESVDVENVDAVLDEGVLSVRLQRRTNAGPRRVQIRAQSNSAGHDEPAENSEIPS